MEFEDQLHRKIHLSQTPSQIVSLVPSQTELLIDLGLRNSIVGITKFCVHPKNLRKEITVVGGTKNVHFDRIEALTPDLIICNKEENTLEMVQQLETIAPVWVSDISTIEESLEMINGLGKILNVSKEASVLISEITLEINNFKDFIKRKPLKKVLYVIWKEPFMVAGKNTFINTLLQLNNFENSITGDNTRYPEIEQADFNKADLVLLSTEPYPFKEKDVLKLQKSTDAKVILVDGEFFSWYGSRLKKAFTYFKTLH
jgi:ABC-type Fe3+-hydroxamate transport system substrate-binding protein